MRRLPAVLAITIAAVIARGLVADEGRADWPHWLGPSQNGAAPGSGIFGRTVSLRKAWSRPLETGHAGLAVAAGRVFTVFTDGVDDYAIALRADTGAEAWRVKLDPGIDRPFLPGPTSTPAYHDGRVFTLSSVCRLRAHDAATGRTQWEIDLKEKFGAKFPMGCGPSPFAESGRLYVQSGGAEDHRVAALDAATGAVVWTSKGAGPAAPVSPVAAEIAGLRQLLVHHTTAGTSGVAGLRMTDGVVLWSASLPAGFSFDTPAVYPGDRVGLATVNEASLFRIVRAGEAWSASPQWRSSELQAWINPAVFHAGHLFGFAGDDLVCASAETGARVWKERTYPGSLILVDGHLVVLSTSAGLIRVVEATPSGYREKGRLQVFNRGAQGWAPPSYAGTRVFIRNEEEVAAVELASPGASSRP